MGREDLKEWDKYANLYDSNKGMSGDGMAQKLVDPTVLELVGNVEGLSLIDAGCGNGYISAKFVESGALDVTGLDGSNLLVGLAQQRFKEIKK